VFCRGPGAQALLQWSFDTRILFEVKYVYVLSLFLKKERMLHIDDFWNKKRVLPAGKIETWHCAAFLFSQVPKKCTNLELSLPYILTLGTYSKFTQEIKFLAPGFCFPQPCSALSAGLLRQDHVYRTTNKSFGFHNKKIDEMRHCKLDSIENLRSFEKYPTPLFCFLFCVLFCRQTTSVPSTSGMHTGRGAVIGNPGSTRLEGIPAMNLGLDGIRTYM